MYSQLFNFMPRYRFEKINGVIQISLLLRLLK